MLCNYHRHASSPNPQLTISILSVAFNFICLLLTLAWYVFRLIQEIYMIVFKSKPVRDTTVSDFNVRLNLFAANT